MSLVTACLKVQVGDKPTRVREVFDDMYNFSMNAPDNISVEQAVVFGLLLPDFTGFTPWFNIMPFTDSIFMTDPSGMVTVTSLGVVLDAAASLTDSGQLEDFSRELPSISPHVTMAGFDDTNLKIALKKLTGVGLPLNWKSLVDATPVSELQTLINQKITDKNKPKINYQPITLKIHRCTESDIQELFRGDHDPHVDMFDTVRFMLAGRESELDSRGFSTAYYDSQQDVIIFKSNYSITQSLSVSLGNPENMT